MTKKINNATKHFVNFHGQNPGPKLGKNKRNRTISVINKKNKTIYLKFTFQGSKNTVNLKKNVTKRVIENHVNKKKSELKKGRVYSSVGRKYNTGAILPSDGRIVPLLSRAIRPS